MIEHWLKLFHTPFIGPKRLKELLEYFGTAEKALTADDLEWHRAKMPKSVIDSRNKINQQYFYESMKWLETGKGEIITYDSTLYPALLKETYSPPMLLFLEGNNTILSTPQIAIVGARKPSDEGAYNAKIFASQLSKMGLTITSGLALGIDKIAHQSAVNLKHPTIAVLGTGLNQIYPKNHRELYHNIIQHHGAVISEYPLSMPPKPQNFPRRNRIIAGLSLGTLVVEATVKSGSLITARLSMEENREVFAIPGSIHKPQSRGCHQLIREGATLVESCDDIRPIIQSWGMPVDNYHAKTEQLSLFSTNTAQHEEQQIPEPKLPSVPTIASDHPYINTYHLLASPKTINELVEHLQISSAALTHQLMTLELEGYITVDQGFYRQI